MKTPATVSRKRRLHKGWVLHRLKNLPQQADTYTVRSALGLSTSMVNRWLADPYFRQAQVAVDSGRGRWLWDRDRLFVWLIAALKVQPKRPVAMNPDKGLPTPSPEEARQMLGMPANYSVGLKRIKYNRQDMNSIPPENEDRK